MSFLSRFSRGSSFEAKKRLKLVIDAGNVYRLVSSDLMESLNRHLDIPRDQIIIDFESISKQTILKCNFASES